MFGLGRCASVYRFDFLLRISSSDLTGYTSLYNHLYFFFPLIGWVSRGLSSSGKALDIAHESRDPNFLHLTLEVSHAHPDKGRNYECGYHERKRTNGERWL